VNVSTIGHFWNLIPYAMVPDGRWSLIFSTERENIARETGTTEEILIKELLGGGGLFFQSVLV